MIVKQRLLAIGICAVIILLGVDIALRIRDGGQRETAAPAGTELSESREGKGASGEDRAAPGEKTEKAPAASVQEAAPAGKDDKGDLAPIDTPSDASDPADTHSDASDPETGERPSLPPVFPEPDATDTPTAQPDIPASEESGSYDDPPPKDELPRDIDG